MTRVSDERALWLARHVLPSAAVDANVAVRTAPQAGGKGLWRVVLPD